MNKETIKFEEFLKDACSSSKIFKSYVDDDDIIGALIDFFDNEYNEFEIGKKFPYEFIENFQERGDGEGYYTTYVFKRKSDGKYFGYTSYDCRIEEEYLYETEKSNVSKWI